VLGDLENKGKFQESHTKNDKANFYNINKSRSARKHINITHCAAGCAHDL